MSATELALAVDVGGTSIKGELVTRDGLVLTTVRRPTPSGAGALDTIRGVGDQLLGSLPRGGQLVGGGVVVPGLVDRAAGIATYSSNIGWRDLPMAAPLSEAWGVPVRIANDVASGGVAEHRLGAGAGESDMAFVPVGTGIAAAIMSGGKLLSGHAGETSEIGHLSVRPGPDCPCGNRGCLDVVASASAIVRAYAERGGTASGAREVAEHLTDDVVAREVWADAVAALADGITIMALVLSPALVVVGGGLSEAGDTLLAPLRAALKERALVVGPPRVTAAVLGERAGVVGAALLAFDGWEDEA